VKRRKLLISPRARRDLLSIRDWYRDAFGPATAAKAVRTLRAGLRAATTISLTAASRPDLPDGYYRVVAKAHLVIFQVRGGASYVVRIVHGARDLPVALSSGD
jgi:plasmid stabilization system protein ParE